MNTDSQYDKVTAALENAGLDVASEYRKVLLAIDAAGFELHPFTDFTGYALVRQRPKKKTLVQNVNRVQRNKALITLWKSGEYNYTQLARGFDLSASRVSQVITRHKREVEMAAVRERLIREAPTPADIPIEALDLTVRAYGRLYADGCKTAGDAARRLPELERSDHYNFGVASFVVIKDCLRGLGLIP